MPLIQIRPVAKDLLISTGSGFPDSYFCSRILQHLFHILKRGSGLYQGGFSTFAVDKSMNNTMNRQNLLILLCMLLLFPVSGQSNNREKYNFNPGWLLYIGDTPGAERTDFSDENWKKNYFAPGF